jgi:hypothetical protein
MITSDNGNLRPEVGATIVRYNLHWKLTWNQKIRERTTGWVESSAICFAAVEQIYIWTNAYSLHTLSEETSTSRALLERIDVWWWRHVHLTTSIDRYETVAMATKSPILVWRSQWSNESKLQSTMLHSNGFDGKNYSRGPLQILLQIRSGRLPDNSLIQSLLSNPPHSHEYLAFKTELRHENHKNS